MQRAGRAGRNRETNARAVLMVQPSVFQEVKSKRKEDIDNGATYRKDVESGLRRWIETKDCRREEAAVYFNDGCERKGNLRTGNKLYSALIDNFQLPQRRAATIASVWRIPTFNPMLHKSRL